MPPSDSADRLRSTATPDDHTAQARTRPEPGTVAVCIPARNPGADLARVLGAISNDGWTGATRELIVALDGPDAHLESVAVEHGARTVVLWEQRSSYAARNAALDTLSDEVEFVLFTDADCIPQRGWTAAHVQALESADLSGGAITFDMREPPSPVEFVDSIRHLAQEVYVTQLGWAATANLGTRRAVADRRFDSSLISGGDQRFCKDAVAAGYRLIYAPDAVVAHPARRTARDLLRKVRRVATGIRSRPQDFHSARLPSLKPRKWIVSRARREGMSQGLLWELRAIAVDWFANLLIAAAIYRARRSIRK